MDQEAELNGIIKRILLGLVKLDFSSNIFETNPGIVATVSRLVSKKRFFETVGISIANLDTPQAYEEYCRRTHLKSKLLNQLNKLDLSYMPVQTVFERINFDEPNILQVFSSFSSDFSALTDDEKKMLFFMAVCQCEGILIKSVIYSNDFLLSDYHLLAKFSLNISGKKLNEIIKTLQDAGLIRYDEKDQLCCLEEKFFLELKRLASIPTGFKKFDLSDYESDFILRDDSFKDSILAIKSEVEGGVTSYVYSLLTENNIPFWYVNDDISELAYILMESRKLETPYHPIIWIDNYKQESATKEKFLFKNIKGTHATVIVSGHFFDSPFGSEAANVSLKDEHFALRVKRSYPQELADKIIDYINTHSLTGDKRKEFLRDLNDMYRDCGGDSNYILTLLPEYLKLYERSLNDESFQSEDFDLDTLSSSENSPYVQIYEPKEINDEELFFDSGLSAQIEEITTLVSSVDNFNKFRDFSRSKPLTCMFLGAPGTGKTAICKHIAKKSKRPLWWIEAGKLMDTLVGGTENRISNLFESYNMQVTKSLDKAFPILLLNECDSLMQSRIENPTKSAEISYNTINSILLDNIERCKGIIFATTNMTNFDEAYSRRFLYKVHFNKPANEYLKKLYQKFLPGFSEEEYEKLMHYPLSPDEIRTLDMKRNLYSLLHNNNRNDFSYIEKCVKGMKFLPEVNTIGFQS
ncbi:MAG: ATP-binding protein [Treponema sp.]|nr:ATP-binding protein [Treponema sp.]